MNLLAAIGAEFQKIFTTRMWWILTLVLVAYVALLAGGLGAFFGWLTSNPDAAVEGQAAPPVDGLAPLIYSFATAVGYVFPVLLGALATTGEFRHQTLTPTFLASPRRAVVLMAKVKALFIMGAVLGVAAFAASISAGAGALAAFDLPTELGDTDTWAMFGRGVLAMALWAAVGVGLGALVPSQVASIVIVIAFTQFLEPTLRFAAGFNEVTANIAQFLPGAASDALVGASFYSVAMAGGGPVLEWWQGGLVMLAIAAAATIGGYFTSWRRDVT